MLSWLLLTKPANDSLGRFLDSQDLLMPPSSCFFFYSMSPEGIHTLFTDEADRLTNLINLKTGFLCFASAPSSALRLANGKLFQIPNTTTRFRLEYPLPVSETYGPYWMRFLRLQKADAQLPVFSDRQTAIKPLADLPNDSDNFAYIVADPYLLTLDRGPFELLFSGERPTIDGFNGLLLPPYRSKDDWQELDSYFAWDLAEARRAWASQLGFLSTPPEKLPAFLSVSRSYGDPLFLDLLHEGGSIDVELAEGHFHCRLQIALPEEAGIEDYRARFLCRSETLPDNTHYLSLQAARAVQSDIRQMLGPTEFASIEIKKTATSWSTAVTIPSLDSDYQGPFYHFFVKLLNGLRESHPQLRRFLSQYAPGGNAAALCLAEHLFWPPPGQIPCRSWRDALFMAFPTWAESLPFQFDRLFLATPDSPWPKLSPRDPNDRYQLIYAAAQSGILNTWKWTLPVGTRFKLGGQVVLNDPDSRLNDLLQLI